MDDAQYEAFHYAQAVQKSVHEKLHAVYEKSAGSMSVKMLAYAEAAWDLPRTTEPSIAEFTLTSDDMALARASDDIGCNQFIGSSADLRRNLAGVVEAMGLEPEEAAYCEGQQQLRIAKPLHYAAQGKMPPLRSL